MKQPLEIFCCAAESDQAFLEKLRIHLILKQKSRIITLWGKSDISVGANKDEEIQQHLANAHIFLLLISPDFLADDYCYNIVLETSLKRYVRGEVQIMPVIVRPAYWSDIDVLKSIQVFPRNGQPISTQPDKEASLWEVAKEIGAIVQRMKESSVEPNSSGRYQSLDVRSLTEKRPLIGERKIPSPKTRKWNRAGSILVLFIIVIFAGGVAFAVKNINYSNRGARILNRTLTRTVTPSAHAYPSYLSEFPKGTFSFFDPLSQPDNHWYNDSDSVTNGECHFTGGALHVREFSQVRTFSCDGSSFSDFVFEVHMTIVQGDCGGITFRDNASIHSYYQFDVCLNLNGEACDLLKVDHGNYSSPVSSISVAHLIQGLNHPITLVVVAQGRWIKLFVNGKQMYGYQDSSFTQGYLNLIARNDYSSRTEVVYSDASLWTL